MAALSQSLPQSISHITEIECKYTGPIPSAERWALRFGGIYAYRTARAKSALHYISADCREMVAKLRSAQPDNRDRLRKTLWLAFQRRSAWKNYLNAIIKAADLSAAALVCLLTATLPHWAAASR
ncbi:MAG: hypothetical protein HQ503_12955 [Rhodospirillales bacterium]|nr:hypothetical protein [Rhodospirillales bacterium]